MSKTLDLVELVDELARPRPITASSHLVDDELQRGEELQSEHSPLEEREIGVESYRAPPLGGLGLQTAAYGRREHPLPPLTGRRPCCSTRPVRASLLPGEPGGSRRADLSSLSQLV